MKRALISRYGAYGDCLHISHIPRILKESGYDYIAVDTNFKGYQILSLNPFIDKFYYFELKKNTSKVQIERRWEWLSSQYDKFINFYHSLEYGCIAMEDQAIYYQGDDVRRKFGSGNYYDISTAWAGFSPNKFPYRGEVYYTDEEINHVEKYISQYKDRFIVMLNMAGSGPHKTLRQADEIVKRLVSQYDDILIITTGDKSAPKIIREIGANKMIDIAGVAPFREALLITKYVDCVIGCESGLMVGSNMWETPTVQLMTAASLENHPNGCKNDFSLQSPAKCSPCHKGPYKYIGCPLKDKSPICVWFDIDKVIEQVSKCYALKGARR